MGKETVESRKSKVKNYKNMLSVLNKNTDDYLFAFDYDTEHIHYFKDITGQFDLPENAVIEDWFSIIYPPDLERVYKKFTPVLWGSESVYNDEYRIIDCNGNRVWASVRAEIIYDDDGKPLLLAGNISATAMDKVTNPITGLLNKRKCLEDLAECVKNKESGTLLLIDVDNFHSINMQYSRAYGNKVLTDIAKILRDIVGPEVVIYHFSIDRFIINFLNKDYDYVQKICDKIRGILSRTCSISAGAVEYGEGKILICEGHTEEETLILYLEIALKQAKDYGGNKLFIFNAEDFKKILRAADLEREINASINNGFSGFYLCYQPKINTQTGKIGSIESLLRFSSEKYGQISPVEFIPILEHNSGICRVGLWVLKTALNQCYAWRKFNPNLRVSVNISGVQLRQKNIAADVKNILFESGLPGEALTLEITEGLQLKNLDFYGSIFKEWREAGIEISIDDFGTGYSNLGYLKNLNVNEIKMDRSFIKDISYGGYNYELLRNTIKFAHNVQIDVCCEGIETVEEVNVVRRLSADTMQGFYFSRPLLPNEIEDKYFNSDSEEFIVREKLENDYISSTEDNAVEPSDKTDELGVIIENVDELVYICDTETDELLYMNTVARKLTGVYECKGKKCYEVMFGCNEHCKTCNRGILDIKNFKIHEEQNRHLNRHLKISEKLILWKNKMAHLVIATDITNQNIGSQGIKRKEDYESALIKCSNALLSEPDLEAAVSKSLSAIGEYFGSERVSIYMPNKNLIGEDTLWYNAYEWCREGIAPHKAMEQNISYEILSPWFDIFKEKYTVFTENFASLGLPVFCGDKAELPKSLVAAPMYINGEMMGFLSVSNPEALPREDEYCRTFARFIGERLASSAENARFNKNINFHYGDILKESLLGLWIIRLHDDESENELYADSTMLNLLGFTESQTPTECYKQWNSRIKSEWREYVGAGVEKMLNSSIPVQIEYQWHHPEMGIVGVRCVGQKIVTKNGDVCLQGYHRILNSLVQFTSVLPEQAVSVEKTVVGDDSELVLIENAFPAEMLQVRETQLMRALSSCAGAYYDFNLTQNRIIGTPVQIVDNVEYDILKAVGLPHNCKYTDVVEYWCEKLDESEKNGCYAFFDTENLEKNYKKGKRHITHTFRSTDILGNPMFVEQTIILYQDILTGDILGLTYLKDLKEINSITQEIERDYLTGLSNRRGAERKVGSFLKSGGILFVLDIDNFKSVNDNTGHAHGDEVLKEVADYLQGIFRRGDVVARFGGDEFVAFIRDIHDTDFAIKKAKEILDVSKATEVSVSVGVTCIPSNLYLTYAEVLDITDKELYKAKGNGKNQYSLFDMN
ncbi:MAG: EAL domain-containing protein [Acutalibacteraceae bacterium]